jgi:hypothetical protein
VLTAVGLANFTAAGAPPRDAKILGAARIANLFDVFHLTDDTAHGMAMRLAKQDEAFHGVMKCCAD